MVFKNNLRIILSSKSDKYKSIEARKKLGMHQSRAVPTFYESLAVPTFHESRAVPTFHQSRAVPTFHESRVVPAFHQSRTVPKWLFVKNLREMIQGMLHISESQVMLETVLKCLLSCMWLLSAKKQLYLKTGLT